MGLALLPVGLLAIAIVVPVLLLALVITLVAFALPVGILAAIFGGPAYLLYRLLGGGRRPAPAEPGGAGAGLSPETVLRRRYVAGELTYQQFQAGMMDLLKERFARGELAVSDYEAELEKLLRPARYLDVTRVPALADAPRNRPPGRPRGTE
jgi:hypothetical protein